MRHSIILCVWFFISSLVSFNAMTCKAMASVEDEHFQRADLNGDGKISPEEFKAFGRKNLMQADSNQDGVLDSTEILSYLTDHYSDIMRYAQDHSEDIGPRVSAYTNRAMLYLAVGKKFSIETNKIKAQEDKVFSKVDFNKDGFVTKDEVDKLANLAKKYMSP